MPARVIPGLAVDVQVSPTGKFLVGCPECNWWPAVDKPLDDRSEAQRTAYNHNLEKHDGAGVEFVPDDILTSKQERIRFLREAGPHQLDLRGGSGDLLGVRPVGCGYLGWLLLDQRRHARHLVRDDVDVRLLRGPLAGAPRRRGAGAHPDDRAARRVEGTPRVS